MITVIKLILFGTLSLAVPSPAGGDEASSSSAVADGRPELVANVFDVNDILADLRKPLANEGICCVCMEPPSSIGTFTHNKKRTCDHFTCGTCAQYIQRSQRKCPQCRNAFTEVEVLQLKTAKDVFAFLDKNRDSKLTKDEVRFGLKILVHDASTKVLLVEKYLNKKWDYLDKDGNGVLNAKEFDALYADFIAKIFPDMKKPLFRPLFRSQSSTIQELQMPSFIEKPKEWFHFVDSVKGNGNGSLDGNEFALAILAALGRSNASPETTAGIVTNAYMTAKVYDDNNNGEMDLHEFMEFWTLNSRQFREYFDKPAPIHE